MTAPKLLTSNPRLTPEQSARFPDHFENINAEPPFLARHGKWFVAAFVVVLAFAAGSLVSRALAQAAFDVVNHQVTSGGTSSTAPTGPGGPLAAGAFSSGERQ